MATPEKDLTTNTADTYNASSDYYDHPSNTFWERFGRRTIQRLPIREGTRILDVCCGSGASAIPAGEKVGSDGFVLGVDLAERLLKLARVKASSRGLKHVEFRRGDMLDLGLSESSFDTVVCVFGIFFVPDMPSAVRELWKLVRPGGQLGITTWGPRFFEPVNTVFWNTVREVRPDLYKGFNPWDRICEASAVKSMMAEGGVFAQNIEAEYGTQELETPDDWWSMIMGSGYRGTVEQLSAEDRRYVREVNLSYIRREGVEHVETNVIYAVADKGK